LLPCSGKHLLYVFGGFPVAEHVASQSECQVVAAATTLLLGRRQMPGDQRSYSEHAYAVTQFFLADYGYCGGVVPVNEMIGSFLAVDGGCYRYLMSPSVVRRFEGDKLARSAELGEFLIA
jgi:hypothetical protein